MRVLIDILHPAHVHVFRHFRTEMMSRGHEICVTARDKDVTVDLLKAYDIDSQVLSEQRSGAGGLVSEMASRTYRLARLANRWKADVLTGVMGPSISVTGRLLGIPSVVLYDTENAGITNRWVYRLAESVITPECYEGSVPGHHETHPSLHELAYLHPNRFSPSQEALTAFGLSPQDDYSVVRLVSWKASHDYRQHGLNFAQQRALVSELSKSGRVVISSEGELAPDLESMRLTGPSHAIHNVLAYARVVVGESATMASEAAVLGVPSFYIAEQSRGYLNELARYGLVVVLKPPDFPVLLERIQSVERLSEATRTDMLADMVDLTAWLVEWFDGRGWRRRS